MSKADPYPVFKGGTAAEMAAQQRRSGGAGGGGCLTIMLIVLLAAGVMVGIGFTVVAVHNCNESRAHEANEARQREDAICAKNPWGTQCPPAAREQMQQRQADDQCAADARKREDWIHATSKEMDGYSPDTFHMSAIGRCSTTLRVREDDCALAHLGEAYGDKPFMRTATSLGFRKVSCGYDEFDLEAVRQAGR